MLSSPVSPDEMDWRTLFPAFYPEKNDKGTCKTTDERSAKVEFADIGCGYGGLLGNLFSIKDARYNVHVTVLIIGSGYVAGQNEIQVKMKFLCLLILIIHRS